MSISRKVMDEAMSMNDWLACFQAKLPMITETSWKEALIEANIRLFSQLTWTNLHDKFEKAVTSSSSGSSLTMTLASSDDPSETILLLAIKYNILYLN